MYHRSNTLHDVTEVCDKPKTGVLVATNYALSSDPGGQQICTREYIEALEGAGFALERMVFAPVNGVKEKLLRRIDRRPYRYFVPDDLANRVTVAARETGASHIFLNTVDVAPLAAELKRRWDGQVVMLSHGLESVDFVHTLRTQNWRRDFSGLLPTHTLKLGQQLVEECRQREHIDKVLCLATFEAEIERWLGARDVLVVPRTIKPAILNWSPVEGRIGFVGRLDHPPNLEGLLLMLDALGKCDTARLDVRVVGTPEDFGARLADRYPFVSYLGVMPDDVLLAEAATWTCATNPIFCYARGASTKLAVMAGWGIPLVTTPQGERGYEWRGGRPVVRDTAEELADVVREVAMEPAVRATAREDMLRLLANSLSLNEISHRVRAFLRAPARATE